MGLRLQLAGCLIAIGLSTALAAPCSAQRGRANLSAQAHRPPAPGPRAQARQQRQQERKAAKAAQQEKRPNAAERNPQGNPQRSANPNRPPSAYTPPAPQRKFSDLTPQEKQRVLENYNRFNKLPPAQREEMRERIATWKQLTPAQKDHIRNDVVPKWRQMPADRRQAIRQRLRVLQNMPEFARNQRLNDPKFTEGMSDEDKATLRDLSHMHVGAPDPPGESAADRSQLTAESTNQQREQTSFQYASNPTYPETSLTIATSALACAEESCARDANLAHARRKQFLPLVDNAAALAAS
ncbi:MAG: DUF3106 domain-containing protein [Candidatus Acidiferrum sp.]